MKGNHMSETNIKEVVKEKYGQAALRVGSGGSSCCGSGPATSSGCGDPITSNLYDAAQTGQIPEEALLASLGCGNPTALAKLNPGEVVLDLGSGGGIDVLLSAKRVGRIVSGDVRVRGLHEPLVSEALFEQVQQ